MWMALDRAYHKIARFFRKWYFRFLPSKPEVIVPVLCNIEWINDDFLETNFSTRNLLIQRLWGYAVGTVYVLDIGFGWDPTSIFKAGFVKSDSKIASWYQLALLAAVANLKILCRKITVRFKLNLKTDGLICKMIFKSGKHVERLHSTRKQCRRIYICLFCVAKHLLETPKPLNCIRWMQAILSK